MSSSENTFRASLFKIREPEKRLKDYISSTSSVPELKDKHVADFCDIILLDKTDLSNRKEIIKWMQNFFKQKNFNCQLRYFGSTVNGLGFYDSDIDLYLEVLNHQKEYYNMMVINAAKCPIVKMTAHSGNKEKLLEFDINTTHAIGVFNSMVLSNLVNSDYRFKQLFAIVKYWAKLNDLINIGIFRSYTFALLVIFFLQDGKVSYIKSLDSLYEYSQNFQENVLPDFESELERKCLDLLINMDQIPSTLTLIHQFFAFYASFDFMNFVISLRFGFAIRKDHFFLLVQVFEDLASPDFRTTPLICLEDPFEVNRNLTFHFKEDKFELFARLCTWYAKKPDKFFYNGSNFARFISTPCKSVVLPVNALKYICPCICILRKYLQLGEKSASEMEQSCKFITEFAKFSMMSVVEQLKSTSGKDKFGDKFEVVQCTIKEDCFQQLVKVEDNTLPQNVITSTDMLLKQPFDLANIQIKLLKQITSESKEKMRKKRKQNLTVDGNEAKLLYKQPSDSADADCPHPLVNATLQCRFISEKNYLFSFKYDQLPPKWLISKLIRSANNCCECKREKKVDDLEV